MLIFKYDLDILDISEVQQIHNQIAKVVTDAPIISIPKTCELYRLEDADKKDFGYIFKGE